MKTTSSAGAGVEASATRGREVAKRPAQVVEDGADEAKKRRHAQEVLSPFSADDPPPSGSDVWFKTQDPRNMMAHKMIWASQPKNEIEALPTILVIEVIVEPLCCRLLPPCKHPSKISLKFHLHVDREGSTRFDTCARNASTCFGALKSESRRTYSGKSL